MCISLIQLWRQGALCALVGTVASWGLGCGVRTNTPATIPDSTQSGRAPTGFEPGRACSAWEESVGDSSDALSHVTFPELQPSGCFVRVVHETKRIRFDPIPEGCGYPDGPRVVATLRSEAARYQLVAEGGRSANLPKALSCDLPKDVRRATARRNANTLRALARRFERSRKRFPYTTVSTFGFGIPRQAQSQLVSWRPGDPCPHLSKEQMDLFWVNRSRAARAVHAVLAGVAPVATFSGGAVHSPLYEAFMLDYLATCRFGLRHDAVLLDPCARHTHENLRNSAQLLVRMGGRTGYVVTDDGLQAGYLQDWSVFNLIGGSLDQRSLRDFGYLIGSWRQASVGIPAGFWFTPYRFWASSDPRHRSFTCVD